jgi:spore coat polysaccharide biosynthesis protein SpsF
VTTVAIVQTRMGSSRLPGKVLEPLGSSTVLGWVVRACREAGALDDVVLTVPLGDERLLDAARTLDLHCTEGPERDLVTRFQTAGRDAGATAVVRITSDCPLLDPALIDAAVAAYLTDPVDYQEARGFPRGLGDADVLDARRLASIDSSAATAWEREHVGPWFLDRADQLRVRFLDATGPLARPELRVCVDEDADLALVRGLVELLGPGVASATAVIAALDANPSLRALNAGVRQRS